jgi:endonuclease-3
MTKKEKLIEILKILETQNPSPTTELKYDNEYQLTVAVVLSAQCTDKRVNLITKNFFKKFKDFKSLSLASIDEIYDLIKSCSYPNNKAKYLKLLSEIVVSKYNGKLTDNYNELITLPGVGPKTANVLLNVLYNAPVIPVDTHVKRVTTRLGLANNKDSPLKVEKKLKAITPDEYLNKLHHWFILHGRYICTAKAPKCEICEIAMFCDFFLTK